MLATFQSAIAFNQNLNNWSVTNVTNMQSVFQTASAFNNGNTSNAGANPLTWTASKCTTFLSMFQAAGAFNQTLATLVDNTSIFSCTLSVMFSGASVFNNGDTGNNGLKPITSWITSKVTNMSLMFNSAAAFNQNISSFNTSNVTTMANMFNGATLFNQNISSWDTSKVTLMNSMFQSASNFNNGEATNTATAPLTWSASLCTTFASMFQSAVKFNQTLPNLVKTSGVASCSLASMFNGATIFNNGSNVFTNWNTSKVTLMNSMFSGATAFNQNIGSWDTSNVTTMASMFIGTTTLATTTKFNNGEAGFTLIPSVTPSSSSYVNSTRVLTCPGATFLTSLAAGDVLIIQTSTIVYSSAIQSITNNTTLVLATAFGSDLASGITSITKQVAGTAPLNWNTSKVTTMANMFQYCVFFNQNITKSGSYWNTNIVTTVASMFSGTSTSLITFFNNGQITTGTTAPMGWTFNVVPTSTNYRTNCRLTDLNKPI